MTTARTDGKPESRQPCLFDQFLEPATDAGPEPPSTATKTTATALTPTESTTPAKPQELALILCRTDQCPRLTSPSFATRNHGLCLVCLKALDPGRARNELHLLIQRVEQRRPEP